MLTSPPPLQQKELHQSDPAAPETRGLHRVTAEVANTYTHSHSHMHKHISDCRQAGGAKWPQMDSVSG